VRSEISRVQLGLATLAGASWLYLVYMAWGMANMDEPAAQLFMPAMVHWGVMDLALVFVMWSIMMAAMMLPSATPMVRMFARSAAGQSGQSVSLLTSKFSITQGTALAAAARSRMMSGKGAMAPCPPMRSPR